jgi:hypothetical protein
LGLFPLSVAESFKTELLRFFETNDFSGAEDQAVADAISKLLPLVIDSLSAQHLNRFLDSISTQFVIPVSLITLLIAKSPDTSIVPLTIAVIRTLVKTDVSPQVLEVLKRCSTADLAEIVSRQAVFDVIQRLFDERTLIDTALILLFSMSTIPGASVFIVGHPVLQSLLQIEGRIAQRLQIFTALFSVEVSVPKPSIVDGVVKLLLAAIAADGLADYALRLIGALSTHRTGCLLIQESGILSLFSQMFLSSMSSDRPGVLTILANTARGRAEIPQIALIISCLMQDLLDSCSNRIPLLLTLTEMISFKPEAVHEQDLQRAVLPLLSPRYDPVITLLAVRLLCVCNVKLFIPFYQKLAKRLFDLLKSENLHPEVIVAACQLIGLMTTQCDMSQFMERTKFADFLQYAVDSIEETFPNLAMELSNSAELFDPPIQLRGVEGDMPWM